MDSSHDEKSKFSRITSIMHAPEVEVTEPGLLSAETIEQVWSILTMVFMLTFEMSICSSSILPSPGISRSGEVN